MSFATAPDGAQIWYHVHPGLGAPASARPTLLIAGQALGAASWLPVVDGFRALGPVITYDHRGVGRSDDVFPRGWSTRDCARDAAAVLDAAGVESAGVYGFSMGGRAAQWLAADHPARVERLVLGATTVGDAHGVPRPEESLRILVRSDRRALLELFFTPGWLDAHPDAADAIVAAPRSLSAQRSHFAASTDHDAWHALAAVKSPTLVVHGADDRMCVAANAHILAGAIADAQLRVYPGVRHGFQLEVPSATDDAVAFLRA